MSVETTKNYEMDLSSNYDVKTFINDYLRKFKIEKRIELKQEDMFMINWQMNILEDVVERFDKSFLFSLSASYTFQIRFMKIEQITL